MTQLEQITTFGWYGSDDPLAAISTQGQYGHFVTYGDLLDLVSSFGWYGSEFPDLLAISSLGWYSLDQPGDLLELIATFGWYGTRNPTLTTVSTFGWYGLSVTPVGFAVAFAGAGFVQRAEFGVAGP